MFETKFNLITKPNLKMKQFEIKFKLKINPKIFNVTECRSK